MGPDSVDGVVNIHADLLDRSWPTAVADQLAEALADAQRICLVHNAALHARDTVLEAAAAELRASLEVQVVAPLLLNQLIAPFMRRGSSITYLGSTLATKTVPNAASYAVAKHAVVGLMRATCQDLAGRGIHTACICPGFTDTDMLREHLGPEGRSGALSIVSDGRFITPIEMADLMFYCAQTPIINGSVIHANLGQIES